MSPQQHLGIVNILHLLMIDGHQSHLLQPVALLTIVNNITQTIELFLFGQFLFRLANSARHTEAEARTLINFNFHAAKLRISE